jgi:hypothetical protein
MDEAPQLVDDKSIPNSQGSQRVRKRFTWMSDYEVTIIVNKMIHLPILLYSHIVIL